jgi:hypothetical protein
LNAANFNLLNFEISENDVQCFFCFWYETFGHVGQ